MPLNYETDIKAQNYQPEPDNRREFTLRVYLSYRLEDGGDLTRAIRDWFAMRYGPLNVASGNIYPWGMKYIAGYSNINESLSGISPNYLRQPVAVGVYPHAVSPYGVYDMIGNVWEWCLNEFHNAASIEAGGGDKRMLCGGSWDSDRLFAHTARRRGEHPGARFTDIGFRVARGAPN